MAKECVENDGLNSPPFLVDRNRIPIANNKLAQCVATKALAMVDQVTLIGFPLLLSCPMFGIGFEAKSLC